MKTTTSKMSRTKHASNIRSTLKTRRGDLRKQLRRWLKTMLLVPTATTLLSASALAQVPTGGNVVAGAATIAGAAGNVDVNATTARAIVNWDSFSIGAGNTANFNLPDANSAILNRVTGTDLSTIAGTLNSNGNVYLVNPNGIMVGSTGVINTNGFTASVFDVGNDAFMAGGPLSFSGDSTASIVNNGSINTGAGGAHLIADQITNNGTIESTGGNITLSGGGEVTLDGGVSYVQPSMETLASGISPTAGLIQNNGVIRATGAATSGGEIYLVNPNGKILHDGTISATRMAQASSLADQVGQASSLSDTDAGGLVASSTTGESSDDRLEAYPTVGGSIMLEADEITLTSDSTIEATGTHGGGEVLVGGDWEGGKEEPEFAKNLADPSSDAFHARRDVMTQATKVLMESDAVIDASATEHGDGGKIVLWSDITNADSLTEVFGTLLAKAGTLFGDGGYIETSGATIDTSGITAIASAPAGIGGLWLIDPYDYNIYSPQAASIVSALDSGTSVTISTATANTSYGSAAVSGSVPTINLFSDIVTGAMSGDATLTFVAENFETNTYSIDATANSNTKKLNVVVHLIGINSGGYGDLNSIKTNGGHIWVGGSETNSDTTTWNGLTVGNGDGLARISASIYGTLDTRGPSGGGEIRIGAGREGAGIWLGHRTESGTINVYTGGENLTFVSGYNIRTEQEFAITTDGGNVIFSSDALGQSEGAIGAGSDLSGRDLTITTAGGDITLGGGNLSGSGFAYGNDSSPNVLPQNGIGIRGKLTLNSGGGDIALRGQAGPGTSGASGVLFTEDSTINSGTGKILIHGVTPGTGSNTYYGISAANSTSLVVRSANTASDAISLTGDATDAISNASQAIDFSQADVSIAATGVGGGVQINGIRGPGMSTIAFGTGEILAANGPIEISAKDDSGGIFAGQMDLGTITLGAKDGSDVTASASNISLFTDVVGLGSPTINTLGNFSLLSNRDGFVGVDSDFNTIIQNANGVTIGKSTNTDAILLKQDINFTGDLNVYGGRISLGSSNQITGSSSSTATFHASTANQSSSLAGSIDVASLLFTGAGDFVASNANNDIGTFASSTTGDVTLANAGVLTIGQVGSTSGVQSEGTIDISTLTGSLTVSQNVATTDTSTQAIRLNASSDSAAGTATGGDILITGGATVSVGTDGRATLYSGSVSGSTGLTNLVGHGSGRFRYNSDESATNFTKALETGVHAIYREQPDYVATSNFSETSVYGTPTAEALNGDRLAVDVDTALFTTSGNAPVGNYSAEFAANAGADLGYGTVSGSGTIEITKRDVTVQGISVADRVYDGTRDALVGHSGVNFDNMIAGDVLTAAGTTGQFDAKDIGNDRVVTLSGTTYGGADLANYNITDQTQTTATISARPITVSGIKVNDKVYDGHTTSTVDLSGVVFGNIVDGETLTIADTIGTFADKNVGVGKLVTLSGSTYGGADVGNYSFTDQPSATATITRLDSVTWTGGNSGNWSDPNNWAGGAIPDLSNVANVIIPDGTTVTYTDLGQAVNVDSLSGGGLSAQSGTLNIAGNLKVDSLSVNWADLNVGGNMDVANSFSQLSRIEVGGTATIHKASGNLEVTLLDAGGANLSTSDGDVILSSVKITGDLIATAIGGDVRQWNGGELTVGGKTNLTSDNNITIDGHNAVNDFQGPVNVSAKDIVLTDTSGGMILDVVDASGDLTVTTVDGGLTQTSTSSIDVGGLSSFDCDGDCTLDGPNNRLLGAISVVANNLNLAQAAEELSCGDIDVVGNLTMWTSGKITQTNKSSVKVGGTAKFFAPKLLLPNFTNEFTTVIYSAADAIINAAGPFEKIQLGSSGESVLDTFTRYEGPIQQPTGGSPFGGMFASQQSTPPPSIRPAAELISPLARIGNFYTKSSGGETYVGTKTSDSPRDID